MSTGYQIKEQKYYLVEIRLEKKKLESCKENPHVDSKIIQMRKDYNKKSK